MPAMIHVQSNEGFCVVVVVVVVVGVVGVVVIVIFSFCFVCLFFYILPGF
jgi:hypothetical protein